MSRFEQVIRQLRMFWQYPVITEKAFFEQNKDIEYYFAFPWATVLDKNYNLAIIGKLLTPYKIIVQKEKVYTCCQHIFFRKFIPLFKHLGIQVIYTPHKIIGEDSIDGIEIIACPLYAVNVEDDARNKEFKNVDLGTIERPYLFSFVGGYQPQNYLTTIRKKIFDYGDVLKKREIENVVIINTGNWHFDKDVYGGRQNVHGELMEDDRHKKKTSAYNEYLMKSVFSLCPSGSGPNSIRLWESLGAGSIPIVLADTLDLPKHELMEKAIIRVKESELDSLYDTLSNMSDDEVKERRTNCLKLYKHFKNNYRNSERVIVHYCCGSYDIGDHGGVARYDYHIKLAFPNRIFVKQHDKKLFELCKKHKGNILVITDNHLACHVPNDIDTILVHHGVAQTHAEREPGWSPYWKNLCCSGQKKMLYYRNSNNTQIISISQFCTDEFTKYYNEIYTKFLNVKILHTSELNEKRYKRTYNKKPIVLGNWQCFNKGKNTVDILKKKKNEFIFQDLKVRLDNRGIANFNMRKQDIYLECDIFLQLSNSEGNSYATLDALLCGMVVVSSNVGLFYGDVPEDCFVKLDWRKNGDVEYVEEKLRYAWENREELSRKAREWYMKHCRFVDWKKRMHEIVKNIFK